MPSGESPIRKAAPTLRHIKGRFHNLDMNKGTTA
jgi:hypothetical protein